MTVLNPEFAVPFPILDASVYPLIWAKQGIGQMQAVILYDRGDIEKLKQIVELSDNYDALIAEHILTLLEDEEEILVQMELSDDGKGNGSCAKFDSMLTKILPVNCEFKGKHWQIWHDHEARPLDK
jgi:hypothetical protein